MVVGNIQAQMPVQPFRVNFNVNEFTLDQQDQSILLQVVNKYKASPYAEVTIAAHTDMMPTKTTTLTSLKIVRTL